MIVITGATGNLGRLVVEALLQRVPASQIAVAVRSPEKATDFAARGIAVRRADYSQPATLQAALADAHKVLLISSSELGQRAAQHRAVIAAATAAKVGLLVYTSILHAAESPLALADEHRITEAEIRASGLPYVFLRNGWYTENYTDRLAGTLAQGGLVGSAGDGRIAAAARLDYAEAAAVVLTSEGHAGKIYELAGDTAFTLRDLAAEISQQSGKAIPYSDLPPEQYHQILVGAGLPTAYADVFLDAGLGIARGALDNTSGDLRRLIGRPTTPLAKTVAAALTAAGLAKPAA